MSIYLVINDGVVINAIDWDGSSPYSSSYELIPASKIEPAWIGWTYDGSKWNPPIETEQI